MRGRRWILWLSWTAWACGGGSTSGTDLPIVFPDHGVQADAGRDPGPAVDPGSGQDPGLPEDLPDDGGPGTDAVPGEDPGAGGDVLPADEGPPADLPAGCGGGPACGPGSLCLDGTCQPCNFDTACGEDCRRCLGTGTPICDQGRCVRCVGDVDCGPGFWCDPATRQCERCRDDDPDHCGVTCLACPGSHPDCWMGGCRCREDSCGDLFCIDGLCKGCDTDDACGSTCQPCPLDTPRCVLGRCRQCREPGDCPGGQWCNQGECVPCALDDPAHCGPGCLACAGETPACRDGSCACQAGSCLPGRRCVDGACIPCDTDDACGLSCIPCPVATPFCRSGACRQCRGDSDCPAYWRCNAEGTCFDPCAGTQGCASDLAPAGKTCATPKVVGRTAAAAGFTTSGDTTNQGNNDDLPSIGGPDCWDARYDLFYRVWLRAGDDLTLTATPKTSTFQVSLKLYRGTSCAASWKTDLLSCRYDAGDGKPETITWRADQAGWYTVVVDGASAFDDQQDWGPFTLKVGLGCVDSDCCCH